MSSRAGGVFRSLHSFNYRVWITGSFVSDLGTWVQRTAQDWLVLTILTHHSARAVGIVVALQFAPQFLFLPWTGSAADHLDRRTLLITTQAAMGMLALTLGVLTVTGIVRLWYVYVFAFAFGSVAAVDAPVRQVFVAQLVGDAGLANAVALNATAFNAARMIGPAVSGIVIAAVGTGWAFVINGASFVAVLLSLVLLRGAELRPHPRAIRTRGSFGQGLRYVWSRGDLRAILIMLFLIGTFGLNFPIFIATMAIKIFHSDARGYGLLSSILAIGTVVGALLSAGRTRPGFKLLLGGAAVFGLGCALAAIAPSYWLFAGALAVAGLAALTFTNTTNSLMQLSTAPAMRGRVMALRVGVALGGTPVGAPLVGWVADDFGPRWALGVGAVSGVAAAIVALVFLASRAQHAGAQPMSTAGRGADFPRTQVFGSETRINP